MIRYVNCKLQVSVNYICIYTCVYTYTHINIYINMCIYTHTHICIYMSYVYVCKWHKTYHPLLIFLLSLDDSLFIEPCLHRPKFDKETLKGSQPHLLQTWQNFIQTLWPHLKLMLPAQGPWCCLRLGFWCLWVLTYVELKSSALSLSFRSVKK